MSAPFPNNTPTPILTPTKMARAFLDKLTPDIDDKFLFCCFDDLKRKDHKPVVYRQDLTPRLYKELVKYNKDGYGIYVTVNCTDSGTKRGKERRKKDITQVRAIWLEDDTPRAEPRTDFPIPPTLIVCSSSIEEGNKYHYYWVVDDAPPEALKQFAGVMRTMVDVWGSDPNAADISRVLRVPGFYNMKPKYDKPMCELVQVDGPYYSWPEITKAFPVADVPEGVVDGTGGADGEEDFDQRAEWDEWADAGLIKDLLALIDPTPLEYDQWLEVGMVLSSGTKRSKKGLNDFIDWSEKDPERFDKSVCVEKWKSFSKEFVFGGTGIGTICGYAKEQNPEEFAKLRDKLNGEEDTGGILPLDKRIKKNTFPHSVVSKTTKAVRLDASDENYHYLMERYGMTHEYDVVTKEATVRINGEEIEDSIARNKFKSLCAINGLPPGVVTDLFNGFADENKVNPAVDCLSQLEYKGDGYIQQLADTITVGADEKDIKNIIVRRWLIQGCAAPDMAQQTPNKEAKAKYESVLIFAGAQGLGKTKWFNELCPPGLSVEKYLKDGVFLDPKDKDSVMKATSRWLIELGEIDVTFTRAAISRLKGYLSEGADVLREPYGHKPKTCPRTTSYFGTVNTIDILQDATGNRRYLPVTVDHLVLPSKGGIDMGAVWAEAWYHYMRGEQWWLTQEEEKLMSLTRGDYEDIGGAIGEKLREKYPDLSPEHKEKVGVEYLTSTQIFEQKLGIPTRGMNNRERTQLRDWLLKNNLCKDGKPDIKKHKPITYGLPIAPDWDDISD